MKQNIGAALAILFFVGCFWACQPKLNEARFMSYNVKNGFGMVDSTAYARTASVILKENPDVVAIQELDSVTGRSHGVYVLGELAKETNMYDTYAPAIDYDGGKYGIGILSKEKPVQVYRRALPGREEARTMLLVEFPNYVYVCMHLSLTEEDALASLPIIREETARFQKPVFIAGDWNVTPNMPFIKDIQQEFTLLTDTTQFTFPADTPNCTIDYIAARKVGAELVEYVAHVTEAPVESDHRPVVVDVTWK